MSAREGSVTAMSVAALRAAHQLIDGEPKILDDRVVLRLVDPATLERIRANPEALREPYISGLRSHVVTRSRYAEDRLADAAARGTRQYVMLGAGLDTFAYRQPHWASGMALYEVDHPASQHAKRQQLAAAGVPAPTNLHYVEADFELDSIGDRLAARGFRRDEPAFVSCLGVLVYLTTPAVEAAFKWAASLARGSAFVFTFTSADSGSSEKFAAAAAAVGEPWKTHFDPAALGEELRDLGFADVTFPTVAQLDEWYFRGRADGFQAPRRARLVHAATAPRVGNSNGSAT